MSTTKALTAAYTARQNKALDQLRRLDGEVTTWRKLVESGAIAYTTERQYNDGTRRYGLITHESVAEELSTRGLQGLAFATYWETPKMVADWATLLPRLVQFGYDGIEIILPDGTVATRLEPTW